MIPVYTIGRIEWLIKHMKYDELSEAQHDLVISFENRFKRQGKLSKGCIDILEDTFQKAEEKEQRWWVK